jgi:hypothetical protein
MYKRIIAFVLRSWFFSACVAMAVDDREEDGNCLHT